MTTPKKTSFLDMKVPLFGIISFAFYVIWWSAQLSLAQAQTERRVAKHEDEIQVLQTHLVRIEAQQDLILQGVNKLGVGK